MEPTHWGVIPHPLRNDLHQDGVEIDAIACGKSLLPIPGTHREATRVRGIGRIRNDFPVSGVGERYLAATARGRRVGLLRQGVIKPCEEEEAKNAEWKTNRPSLVLRVCTGYLFRLTDSTTAAISCMALLFKDLP